MIWGPKLVIGDFEADAFDPRPTYRRWLHVPVKNTGRRAARECVVTLEATAAGQKTIRHPGVFLKSDVETPVGALTIYPGRKAIVPVVLGPYLTTGRFFHDDLRETQRLAPGRIVVCVTIEWLGGRTSRQYEYVAEDD